MLSPFYSGRSEPANRTVCLLRLGRWFAFMIRFAIIAIFIFLLTAFGINAQTPADKPSKLDAKRPSVYISFERVGKASPLYEGESDQRIWLRLRNNTSLNIFTCYFLVAKDYGDTGMYFTVDGPPTSKQTRPLGYGRADDCSVLTIKPGESALFSIPREDLQPRQKISVSFHYGWTNNWKEDMFEGTSNEVGFGYDELPFTAKKTPR